MEAESIWPIHVDRTDLESKYPGTIKSLGSSLTTCQQVLPAKWPNRAEILHDAQPVAITSSADVGLRRCIHCAWEFRP